MLRPLSTRVQVDASYPETSRCHFSSLLVSEASWGARERTKRILARSGRVATKGWKGLTEVSLEHDCLVFGIEALTTVRVAQVMRIGTRKLPWVVAIVRLEHDHFDNLKTLVRSPVHVVPVASVGLELPRLLSRATAGKLGPWVTQVVLRSVEVPPRLEQALRLAATIRPPLRSVEAWANECQCPDHSLRRLWREFFPESRPKDFLRWLLLLRAIERRVDSKWEAVARQCDTTRRTLERTSHSLVGMTLAQAARANAVVRDRFRDWVIAGASMRK